MSAAQRLMQALLGLVGSTALLGGAVLTGCGGGGTTLIDSSIGVNHHASSSGWTWELPAGFPVPRVPADNPMSAAKVELGRFLFYDKRLSGNGT